MIYENMTETSESAFIFCMIHYTFTHNISHLKGLKGDKCWQNIYRGIKFNQINTHLHSFN